MEDGFTNAAACDFDCHENVPCLGIAETIVQQFLRLRRGHRCAETRRNSSLIPCTYKMRVDSLLHQACGSGRNSR